MSLYDLSIFTCKQVQFINIYQSLIDSYIVEFFTESHWNKLPAIWRETLNQISLDQFCNQICNVKSLQSNENPSRIILPLSLLAFSATADTLSFPLYPSSTSSSTSSLTSSLTSSSTDSQVMDMKHLFRRHVKLKKQHEIKELIKVIQNVCEDSQTHNVIDIGCGQGHLTRCLAYHCCYSVTAVEAVGCHLETAMQYDRQVTADIERELKAKNQEIKIGTIRYIEQLIEPTVSSDILSSVLLTTPAHDKHVLVGLHSCGDLSVTLLRWFSECQSAIGLVSVGCCYMKLSHNNLTSSSCSGYPMSHTLRDHSLSYESKELACHSKEVYIKRLSENSEHIKIHCWRAAIETILRKHGMKRPHIKIPSSVSKLPFKEYANAILQSLGLTLTQDDIDDMQKLIDKWWKRVVVYFVLRLKMAPCIESLLLLDRMLFLQEKDIKCRIRPLFNPLLSPRNLVLTAVK